MSINQVAPTDAVNLASQNSVRRATEISSPQPAPKASPKDDSQPQGLESSTVKISDAARAALQDAAATDAKAAQDSQNADRQAQDALTSAAAVRGATR